MPRAEYLRTLRVVFERTPKILGGMDKDKLATLRTATAMGYVFGSKASRITDGYETGIQLDAETACRMLYFSTNYFRTIAQLESAGIKKVRILSVEDSCAECKQISKQVYQVSHVPELPHALCTHPKGCRCAVVGDFSR